MQTRRRDLWLALVLLTALSLGPSACSDSSGGGGDGGGDAGATDGDDAGATDGDDGDATDGDVLFEPNPACAVDQGGPDGDWDCDGVLNATEQTHGTDPFDADSDDDGLCDGPIDGLGSGCDPGEDLNGNGVVDNGESDPRDANDPPPGSPSSLVCNAARAADIDFDPATAARANLALPAGLTLGPAITSSAHTFAAPALGVFGYIYSEPMTSTTNTPLKASLELRLRITPSDIVPAVVSEEDFYAWRQRAAGQADAQRGDPKHARRDEWALSFDADTDPAATRDAILAAISAQAVSGPDAAPTTCTSIVMHQMIELTDDDRLLTIGALACADDFSQEATRVLISDLMSTTQTAPTDHTPNHDERGFFCEQIAAELGGGLVDFIFMLDNSGSMLDEQQNVVAASDEFLAQLAESSLDWRIGVATTESYCRVEGGMANPSCAIPAGDRYYDDPLLVSCAGLREPGFLAPGDLDLQQLLADAILHNPDCEPNAALNIPQDVRDSGPNLCGHGFERGLDSTLATLDALTSPAPAGSVCADNPAYRLRPGAQRVIIFLSDEEDESFKDNPNASNAQPLSANALQRLTLNQSYIDQLTAPGVDARAFAIVGDGGIDNGGACGAFNGSQGTGAVHGLAYIDVARGTGGAFGTICNDDFTATIEAIIRSVVGQITSYELTAFPIASTLAVAIDDQVLGRTGLPRFEYDAATNGITLYGVSLARGQTIAVSYKRWAPIIE